jgi:hypothetical protein
MIVYGMRHEGKAIRPPTLNKMREFNGIGMQGVEIVAHPHQCIAINVDTMVLPIQLIDEGHGIIAIHVVYMAGKYISQGIHEDPRITAGKNKIVVPGHALAIVCGHPGPVAAMVHAHLLMQGIKPPGIFRGLLGKMGHGLELGLRKHQGCASQQQYSQKYPGLDPHEVKYTAFRTNIPASFQLLSFFIDPAALSIE